MMKKAVKLMICSMILLMTASCNGLISGVGIRGISVLQDACETFDLLTSIQAAIIAYTVT